MEYEERHIYDERAEVLISRDVEAHQEKIEKFLDKTAKYIRELTRVRKIGPKPKFDHRRLSK